MTSSRPSSSETFGGPETSTPPTTNAEAEMREHDGMVSQHIKDSNISCQVVMMTAYATVNQLEYFAEVSAMYFVGGNYFPYDRDGLRVYDPKGVAMVELLWKVR